MALGFGTNIPSDGMVFNFDPGNKRCYSGTGSVVSDLVKKHQGSLLNSAEYINFRNGIISLDGSTQAISFPDVSQLRWNGAMSVGGWHFHRDDLNLKMFISKGSLTSAYNAYSLFYYNSRLNDNFGSSYTGPIYTPNYTWNHVFMTYDGSTINTYLNGSVIQTRSLSSGSANIISDAAPLLMGAETESGSTTFYTITDIGQVVLYNRVLSSSQVFQLYNATKARYENYNGITSILLNGDSLNNVSSYTSFTSYGNVSVTNTQQKYSGSAIYFDGNGDYLQSSSRTAMAFGLSDFTIEAFVKLIAMPTSDAWPTNYSSHMMLTCFDRPSSSSGFGFLIGQTKLIAHVNDSQILSGTHGMTTGQWYHVACCRKNGTLRLFVNGTEVASAAYSTRPNIYSTSNVYIGCETGQGAFLNGYIDGLRVVKDNGLYSANFTPPSTQLSTIGD